MPHATNPFTETDLSEDIHHPGWIRFWNLPGEFQLFLIDDMFEYSDATRFIDGDFYVSLELVHKYTEHDLDWTKPRNPIAVRSDRSKLGGNWYPLYKLRYHPVLFELFADYIDNRGAMNVVDDVVYVSIAILAGYTSGDDKWLYAWAD